MGTRTSQPVNLDAHGRAAEVAQVCVQRQRLWRGDLPGADRLVAVIGEHCAGIYLAREPGRFVCQRLSLHAMPSGRFDLGTEKITVARMRSSRDSRSWIG